MPLPLVIKAFVLVLACAYALGRAHAANDQVPSSFDRSANELRSYCIERICLGSTPQSVAKLGTLTWEQSKFPTGELACTEYLHSNHAAGRLVTMDGTEFALRFELVSTSGHPEDRYRLMSAAIKLPKLTSMQVDSLIEALTDRVGAGTKGPGIFGAWYGESKSNLFRIRVDKDSERGAQAGWIVTLSADYKLKTQWLLQQQPCRSNLPRL